ncbi:MAG TPA: enolase C-terminal domain-like protein [Blastocatellia bacterium]|jgi:L-alanine-DL-glutamate epimerase-like enolase superfamily enzyme|nr:enolase C-terminal domain-like protein [Blastocatellia bacterium]
MNRVSRRAFLRAAACSPAVSLVAGPNIVSSHKPSDIRIEEVSYSFEDHLYRAPYKFGGRLVDRVTLLNVTCDVRTANGPVSKGFGSMPLGNVWSFPSRVMSYDATLGAMKALADRIRKITASYKEPGHPLDINFALEPAYLKAAAEVSKELSLAEPIPKLCTLVTASPFDAAIHDGFGKAHRLNCYHTYGPDFATHDLSRYLGRDFKGEFLDRYILKDPTPRVALYHSVGALDALEDSDVKQRIGDGLPETLPEWIDYNGITHIKIKLNGEDRDWDTERVIRIDRVATAVQKRRGVTQWKYLLDFNENCANVGYLLEVLRRVKAHTPEGFNRIQYIEQPTARDLKAHRSNVMHEAAKLRPIVIDESLTDLESLMLAREMGYTGVALKACKGQSQALLMAAAAQKYRMFLCVQDLTCPGASLVHSAGLAAHVPEVAAIEANSRQYVPSANRGWEKRFPGIFVIKKGFLETNSLTGDGLGAVNS